MSFPDGRDRLIEQLLAYIPYNEQEEKDRDEILRWLDDDADIFKRRNAAAHMTASAWVTDQTCTRILMAYHNIYRSWSWLGGHADGDTNLLRVALREVTEESSVRNVHPLLETPFSVEILTVDGHEKRGHYVSSHLHLNVTYLLEADSRSVLASNPEENSAVCWFPLDEAVSMSSEHWFRERIYSKLNEKLRKFIETSSKTL